MSTKRKNPADHGDKSFPVRVGQHNNFFRFEDEESVVLMSAHLEMMQKFMNFCREKKVKYAQELSDKTKFNLHEENESLKRKTFKEKLTSYFGENLPSHVVDELCLLVEENSYGKCHYCSMPTESLVLSVLQILLHACENVGKKTNSSQALPQNCINESHTCHKRPACNTHDINSIHKKAPPASDMVHENVPSTNGENGKHAASDKGRHTFEDELYNGNESTQSFLNQIKANHVPILDTSAFLFGREFIRNTSLSSQQAPAMLIKPKSKPNRFISELPLPAVPPFQAPVTNPMKDVSPEVHILKERKSKVSSLDLGKLADQVYNKKNVNIMMTNNITHAVEGHSHQFQSAHRFNVSETDMRYYKVLCGLAHSQWSCLEGVKLFKTSVTYNSLGESIEPLGHVDNFFIAGYCRKLFDDSHPRESRKHFFYPRIGGCLLSYKSAQDANTVKNSFLGANSALKLHLADKLCFPIFHTSVKHWSVFIVDLRLKLFVFLDSMFGDNDSLQIHARGAIVSILQLHILV